MLVANFLVTSNVPKLRMKKWFYSWNTPVLEALTALKLKHQNVTIQNHLQDHLLLQGLLPALEEDRNSWTYEAAVAGSTWIAMEALLRYTRYDIGHWEGNL